MVALVGGCVAGGVCPGVTAVAAASVPTPVLSDSNCAPSLGIGGGEGICDPVDDGCGTGTRVTVCPVAPGGHVDGSGPARAGADDVDWRKNLSSGPCGRAEGAGAALTGPLGTPCWDVDRVWDAVAVTGGAGGAAGATEGRVGDKRATTAEIPWRRAANGFGIMPKSGGRTTTREFHGRGRGLTHINMENGPSRPTRAATGRPRARRYASTGNNAPGTRRARERTQERGRY